MKEITLDELISEIQQKESRARESPEVKAMIADTAGEIFNTAQRGKKCCVLTDYDCDGICSAYIMEKTLKAINPALEVQVICNDRRNGYGVPKDLQAEKGTQYIVLDMGSNELPYIRKTFGNDTIVADHHLINDAEIAEQFQQDRHLLNPHCFQENDGSSAEYCATGLAFRIYQELARNPEYAMTRTEKLDNTIAVIAGIGTVGDVVNINDTHSDNRKIVRNALHLIDSADMDSLDNVIGYMLAECGVGDGSTTAKQIGFNVSSVFNSYSRMSEAKGINGAQRTYEAISGNETQSSAYFMIDELQRVAQERKDFVKSMQQSSEYNAFIAGERQQDGNIAVFLAPDNCPSAMCGLIANRLVDCIDKAVIVIAYSKEKGYYAGSGRNSTNNTTGLKAFIDSLGMQGIEYGGHQNAIGISHLDDAEQFVKLVEDHATEMQRDTTDKPVLKISIDEITAPETLEKVMGLEPLGEGCRIPVSIISGKITKARKVGSNDNWRKITLASDTGKEISISCWSGEGTGLKRGMQVSLPVALEPDSYGGLHLGTTAVYDKEIGIQIINEKTTPTKP